MRTRPVVARGMIPIINRCQILQYSGDYRKFAQLEWKSLLVIAVLRADVWARIGTFAEIRLSDRSKITFSSVSERLKKISIAIIRQAQHSSIGIF